VRRLRATVPLAIVLAGLLAPAAFASSLEYRVKAAFLYNFAKFIEWPPQAFPDAETPYGICLLGQDPFGGDLNAAVAGNLVEGRKLVVRRVAEPKGVSGCHILFVAASEHDRLRAILGAVGEAPTLTVGEDEDFTRLGGGLRFFLSENRVRFEINLVATDRAHLKISAKLLSLARVIGKPAARQ